MQNEESVFILIGYFDNYENPPYNKGTECNNLNEVKQIYNDWNDDPNCQSIDLYKGQLLNIGELLNAKIK